MTPAGFAFNTTFAPGYHRAFNRGKRNLRCFPHCGDRGHVKSGFCGAPLEFQLNELPEAANGIAHRVLTWGEFQSALAPPRFNPGDLIAEEVIEEQERYVSATSPFSNIR
jgi:hypothetical protein